MTLVRIIKKWDKPDLMRQTPHTSAQWDGIHFTLDPIEECDYAVILNDVPEVTNLYISPHNIWHLTQEPPVPQTFYSRPDNPFFYLKFTPDITKTGSRHIHSHTALPWHVDKTYDFLKNAYAEAKPKKLTWITSNLQFLEGHIERLRFLEYLQTQLEFDLWGRGFKPIADKWEGLAPYQYALAVENYSGPHYWTEKIADCFLAWTMPIYYGATNIGDYFPSESFVQIDIEQPEAAVEIITETIQSDLYLKNRDAIAYARELILEKYQFFPFIVYHIDLFKSKQMSLDRKLVTLVPTQLSRSEHKPPLSYLKEMVKAVKRKLLNKHL